MPRKSRKKLVGKIENDEIEQREEQLAALGKSLHGMWRWQLLAKRRKAVQCMKTEEPDARTQQAD